MKRYESERSRKSERLFVSKPNGHLYQSDRKLNADNTDPQWPNMTVIQLKVDRKKMDPSNFLQRPSTFEGTFCCLLLFEHNEMTSDNDPIVITFIQINI